MEEEKKRVFFCCCAWIPFECRFSIAIMWINNKLNALDTLPDYIVVWTDMNSSQNPFFHSYRLWFSQKEKKTSRKFNFLLLSNSQFVCTVNVFFFFAFGSAIFRVASACLLITETHCIVQLVQKVWQLKWTRNKIDNLTFIWLQQWLVI